MGWRPLVQHKPQPHQDTQVSRTEDNVVSSGRDASHAVASTDCDVGLRAIHVVARATTGPCAKGETVSIVAEEGEVNTCPLIVREGDDTTRACHENVTSSVRRLTERCV